MGNECTRRPGQRNQLDALKACGFCPTFKIIGGIVEGIAVFNEHVRAHHQAKRILPASSPCRILPIVISSAAGKASFSKSPLTTLMRSDKWNCAIFWLAR